MITGEVFTDCALCSELIDTFVNIRDVTVSSTSQYCGDKRVSMLKTLEGFKR